LHLSSLYREREAYRSHLDFDVPLSLTAGHSESQLATPIVVSEVGGLYQTIWDTVERHFGLQIWRPLLFIIKIMYIEFDIFLRKT
jgi:hypothetical protein